ncbi:YbjP/YqhG family protein [Mesorhizobium sp. BR-1-1-10]|uniref:YbjP/YqhG family protein n=1 Tax=Mesorhizobium sp. BR-1-1-10 TaxID=2876660 RepID=UPI001CD16507|nr:YbjP/YqhG family protein [Mesorhizobium sp. BR-1-1-10]MBZ9974744.1 YbjP/YqhG family protein [Mesorhizobium sp. BR-1-1-10]
MAGRTLLLFSAVCLLAADLNGAAAQGLLGAPPAKAPAGTAPDDSVTPPATPPGGAAEPPTPPVASPPSEPAAPIQPGSPTAVVRPFYDQVGLEVDPAQRGHFIDPAKTVLDKSDALRKSGQGECLDPNMALDNADYDKAEIDKSLKTLEAINGDQAKVIVAFVVAGNPHRLEWKFKKVDGEWKIADLLSVTGEWALSQYQCE